MPQITLNVTENLLLRMKDWSRQVKRLPEVLAIDLLEEYFEESDDADRLEELIANGQMETSPYSEARVRLGLVD